MPGLLRGSSRLALVALLSALALPASAAPWLGITPGTSTVAQVVAKFGEPAERLEKSGRTVLSYQGERAIKGTRQANFYFDAAGRVDEIHVFPASVVPADAVEGTYGKDYVKRLTEDFRTYYWYGRLGLVVFLSEDAKKVYSFIYTAPKAPGTSAPQGG